MMGTSAYIFHFMWMSVLSQVVMVILHIIIKLLMKKWKSVSFGLWTMVLVEMTIDSLKDPDLARNL